MESPRLLSQIGLNCGSRFTNRKRNIFILIKPRTNLGLNSLMYNMCSLANSLRNIDFFMGTNVKTLEGKIEKEWSALYLGSGFVP